MTTNAEYTAAEWEPLTDLPRMAAFGAMAAEEGDAITSTRELWAGMMELTRAARSQYPSITLIQEIAQAVAEDDEGAEVSRSGWRPRSGEPLGAAMIQQALETAGRVRQILAERATPEDAAAYTEWVLGIARAGCEAARTGIFGLGGERVTEREAAFVEDLATALGAPEPHQTRTL